MTRSHRLLELAVVSLLFLSGNSFAADIVWDGTAADGFWTNGPQNDPNNPFPDNAGQGANWTIDSGTPGQIVTPDAGPGGAGIDYTFNGHNWTISGATISEDVQVKLDGGMLNITNSTVSLLPSSANTGSNLSGLNLGQNGAATSATFTSSDINISRSNGGGRALGLISGSSLDLIGTSVNLTAEGVSNRGKIDLNNGSSLSLDPNSSLTATGNLELLGAANTLTMVPGSSVNVFNLRANSGGEGTQDIMVNFGGGSFTVNDSNPFRDNSSFEGQFNWTGVAGSGTVTHTDLSENNNNLAGKVAQGFFSIEGTRIEPSLPASTIWSVPANIDALNAQLAAEVVNSKFFEVEVSGSTQILKLVASSVINWLPDADENWNDPNNWSSVAVPGVSDDVLFAAGAITAPRTVDIDTAVVVNKLTVGGSNQYTFDDLSGGTLDVNEYSVGGGTHEIAAPLAGGNTTISGAGTLILSSNNSGFTGDINIASGTLRINDPNNLGSGAVTVDGTLRFGDGYDAAYSKPLIGSGDVTVNLLETSDPNAIETLDLTGNNSAYTGTFTVQEGVLLVDNVNDLGDPNGITSIAGSTGVVQLNGGLTYNESFSLGGRAGNNFAGAEILPHLRNDSGNNTITGSITTNGGNFHNVTIDAGTTLTVNNTAGSPAVIDNTNGTLRFQGDGNTVIGNSATPGSGQITGDGNILKQGTGTLTIATASTDPNQFSTGDLTIEEGTVEVLFSGSNNGELANHIINVQAGATFDIDAFSFYNIQFVSNPDETVSTGDEIGQTITGAGTIVAQTLNGFEHMNLSPGDSVGTLTIQGNFSMITGTANAQGRLSYELGDTTTVGGTENDLVDITGNLTIDAGSASDRFFVNVIPVEGTLAAGNYRLMNYGGSLSGTGSGSNFGVNIVDSDDPNSANSYGATRQMFAVSTATSGQVNLVVTGSSEEKDWVGNDGTNPTFWDIDNSDNWSFGGADNEYLDLDEVTFGDSPSSLVVEIQQDVRPGSVRFNNSTGNDYTIGGADPNNTGTAAFGISGWTSVVKDNTGTAELTSRNSFQGGIVVNNGTLILNGPNGGVRGDVTVATGATLQLGNGLGSDHDTFPNGNPTITINGTLVENETDREALGNPITGTGSVRVEAGVLELNNPASTYSGGSVINGGTLEVDGGGNVGTGTITINGGQFRANGESHTISNNIVLNGGTISVGGSSASAFTLDGNVTVSGTGSVIKSDGGTGADGLTMAGTISGSSDLQVAADGGATVNFTGAVSTTGTIIKTSNGTMALSGGTGTISSPTIDVASGDLDVTGAAGGGLALSGQILSGEATVTGNVSTTSNSRIRVGNQGLGNERLVGHWQFDTNNGFDSSLNSRIASLGVATGIDPNTSASGAGSLTLKDNTRNGGANRATINGFSGPTGNSGRTYSFWLNAPDPNTLSQNNSGTLISAGSNNNSQRFDIKLAGGDQLRVEIAGNGISYPSTDGGVGFLDGGWHHVAVTLTDGGTLDDVKLYLDGTLVADDGASGGAAINTAVTDLFFGDSHNGGNDREFQGNMDDIQLYDVELDPNQVAFLFNNPGVAVSGLPLLFESVDFEISGDLTLDVTATVEIDLASTTAFDKLIVGGDLAAAGMLDVNLSGGFAPSDGDSFDILDFDPNGVSGSFVFDLPVLTGGLSWDTSSVLVDGVLSVVGGQNADFDTDGIVTGLDFLILQRNFGTGTTMAQGDADNDGDVDSDDLMIWENQFGSPPPLGAAVTSVPEPSALLLLSLAGVSLATCRRRR